MKRAILAMMTLALAGCYSTTTIGGDTHTDGTSDPVVDPGVDPGVDPVVDTPPDTPWPDVPPDIVPDGTEICPGPNPPPYGPQVSWQVDGTSWPDRVEINQSCRVQGVTSEEEGHTVITLTCWDSSGELERHWIDIWAEPYMWPPVWEGSEVFFTYMTDPIFWVNRWFSLTWSPGGDLVMGGIDADTPNPPIYGNIFGLLQISVAGGYCPWEAGDCYDLERQALLMRYPYAEDTLAFDSTRGYVGEWGSYEYAVSEAVAYHDVTCTDIPGGWYSAVVFATMWD